MEEKKITTEVALPGNPTIYGNYSLLYSIFRNLYDNAIAYAGEGIHLTVSCYKEDPKFYYFSFSDNGVGVSEEHVNRIFERFYRVDKSHSRASGGTGWDFPSSSTQPSGTTRPSRSRASLAKERPSSCAFR